MVRLSWDCSLLCASALSAARAVKLWLVAFQALIIINIIIIIITIIIIISIIIIIMTMCYLSMAVAAVASWCSTSDLIFSLLARVSAVS